MRHCHSRTVASHSGVVTRSQTACSLSRQNDREVRAMKIVSQLAQRLKSLGTNVELPKGTALFAQGEPAKGVFILNAGRAYVSLLNDNGKAIWSRIVGPGAILGLPASMGGQPYGL